MKRKIAYFVSFLILVMTLQITVASTPQKAVAPVTATTQKAVQPAKIYNDANPVDIVNNPQKYLNTNIRVKGIFDKFSVVGLDYKPAFRNSQDYILFLIRRNEIKGHVIPLAEMKIFLKRKDAEKNIDLESGDEIQFEGKVFSAALGDPWIDADKLTILKKMPKSEENK